MKVTRLIPGKSGKYEADLVNTAGDTDYIKNNVIYEHSPARSVIVAGSGDLSKLNNYEVGTIAYVAGFSKMWQLDASGNWVTII